MLAAEKVLVAAALARARKSGAVDESIDLRRVRSLDEASVVQMLASADLVDEVQGFSLAATSSASAHSLSCEEPVYGPLFESAHYRSGKALRVTPSMIGVGAQIAFTFGRTYPQSDYDLSSLSLVADAIVTCSLGLQIVSRRVPHATPLNSWTATADFGLAGAYIEGPSVAHWRKRLSRMGDVTMRMDGHALQHGRIGDTMGHPLRAVHWLAKSLHSQGKYIEAGSIVTTGSCTNFVQLTPQHTVVGDFSDLGSVSLSLI